MFPISGKGVALFEGRQALSSGPSDKEQCGTSLELQGKFRITWRKTCLIVLYPQGLAVGRSRVSAVAGR